MIDGKLPINKTKLVEAWIIIHKDELLANWDLASKGKNIYPIEPLK